MLNYQQKSYIDIPINIDDTPSRLYDKNFTYVLPNTLQDTINDFLGKLQSAIKDKNEQKLYSLYENYFPQAEQKFGDVQWPQIYTIEEKYDTDFTVETQAIYNKLKHSKQFDKLRNLSDIQSFKRLVHESSQNYNLLMQNYLHHINLPATVTWSILDSFLYQFSHYHYIEQNLNNNQDVKNFNFQNTILILEENCKKINKNQYIKPTNSCLLGYYSMVALAHVHAYLSNYSQALKILENISLNEIIIYSRSFECLLNLIWVISFCYFMLYQYNKSARLIENILIFYLKNKKYLHYKSKSNLYRLYQKIASLLCLNYIFLEEKPKNTIIDIFKNIVIKFKDQNYKQKLIDRYYKIKQNGLQYFMKLFLYCTMPVIGPKQTMQQLHQNAAQRFNQLSKITLNTIINHYTEISLKKASKILEISQNELIKNINNLNVELIGQSQWDKTVIIPLMNQKKQIKVQIIQTIIHMDNGMQLNQQDQILQWQQYREQLHWLHEKINSL